MAAERKLAPLGILTSRIGRRLVVLFLGCALVPLAAFAWLTLARVTEQMNADAREALHQGAKTSGMGLAARLGQVAADLIVVAELVNHQWAAQPEAPLVLSSRLAERCAAIWVQDGDRIVVLRGEPQVVAPPIDRPGQAHLQAGKPLVCTVGSPPYLVMLRCIGEPGSGRLLLAELSDDRFWDPQELRSPGAQFTVLDPQGRVLCHSFDQVPTMTAMLANLAAQQSSGTFEWDPNGEPHLARYWRAFLRPQYALDLMVVQSRPIREASRLVDEFVWWFGLTAACTLLCVLLASLVQMRRTLGPILSLREATRRVAQNDFEARVSIRSTDEFGELGRAFNQMTSQLQENVRRREQTEHELVASRDEALAAARAKADFVTNVSHEFRTPMAEILGATEILSQMEEADAEARREFASIAFHGATRLARLVDDVLQIGSTVAWDTQPTDVAATLRDAVASMPRAVAARIRCDIAPDLPPVQGVDHRLVDMWCRLLDNAQKFGPREQTIDVRARLVRGDVVVEIVDQGVGISRQDVASIFEPFHQVGRDLLTEKAHGTGLGLTLVKNTVERHGGRIEVDSELGNGATFRVVFPAAAMAPVTVG